jgi:predicted deacetylase
VTTDERRSAELLFARERAAGRVGPADIDRPEVARAVRSRRVPPAPRRLAQRLAMRRGRLSYVQDCLSALGAAREAVLGAEARSGGPRVLVRVDEFPHAGSLDRPERYGSAAFERFHSILAEAGVPYLLAVTPKLSRDHLDPSGTDGRRMSDAELALLRRVLDEGAVPALHGLDHRTRHADPRRRSEFTGLAPARVEERLERAQALLREGDVTAGVFVPPFNRFDASQYELLAARFEVVCGGPESVALMGYHRTPLWRAGAVYLPSYEPFYARSATVARALERHAREGAGLWVPVTLHWGWEADDGWDDLEHLVAALAPVAASWQAFLAEVRSCAPNR